MREIDCCCILLQARQGDYLSGIAYRAGIDIEQLLLDNVERLDRLDAPLAAKQQLLICNPKLYTARGNPVGILLQHALGFQQCAGHDVNTCSYMYAHKGAVTCEHEDMCGCI